MGKKPRLGARPKGKLSHKDCQKKVCLICFETKSYKLRDISTIPKYVEHIKEIIGVNFDIQNEKQPVGLCETCRKKYFSVSSMEAKVRFTLPPYLYTVVLTTDDVNLPCECQICQKVRGKEPSMNLMQNQAPKHAGTGRPKLSEDMEKEKKFKASPPNACSNCLCLKGPDHDHKKCNEVTKIKNVLDLAVVEGNVTKLGATVAGVAVKATESSPNGTKRLSLPKTGTKLPVTVGPAKPTEPKPQFTTDEVFKFAVTKNLPVDTTKSLCTFLNKKQKGSIETGFQEKLSEKYKSCSEYFVKEPVQIFDEEKNQLEEKVLVRVTDLSEFILFVADKRKLDPQKTEALLNIDKGGRVLKTTLTLKQEKEVEGEPLSTGVKKSFIVAAIVNVNESH